MRGTLHRILFALGLLSFAALVAGGVSGSLRDSGRLPLIYDLDGRVEWLVREGRLAEARAELRQKVRLAPDMRSAQQLVRLGNQAGDREAAIAGLEAWVGLDPRYADAHLALAYALVGDPGATRQDLVMALAHARRARVLVPDSAQSHEAAGLALVGLGRDKQAVAELRAALAAQPDLAQARQALARLEAD